MSSVIGDLSSFFNGLLTSDRSSSEFRTSPIENESHTSTAAVRIDKKTQYLHELIFSGGIKKGGTWGGSVCASAVAWGDHVIEVTMWTIIAVSLAYYFNINQQMKSFLTRAKVEVAEVKSSSVQKILDKVIFSMHLCMWLQVLYYKINLKSLVNLLQPCHLALFFQGLAIVLQAPPGALVSVLIMPMGLVGAALALAYPATEGLDQPFEEVSFFIQHYLLLITPVFLLWRNNYLAWKMCTFKNIMMGNWVSMAVHWILFAHLDRYFQVNVNFFLCPSEGMLSMYDVLPSFMLWPSYRSFLSALAFLLSVIICYFYVLSVGIIYLFFAEDIGKKMK